MVCRTSRGSQAIRQLLPDCRVYFLGFFCAASIGSGRVYVCAWPKIVHQQTMHIRDVRSNVRIWGMNWLLLWMVLQFTQGCVAYQSVRPLSVLTLRVVIYIFIVIQYDSECEWEFVFFLSFFFFLWVFVWVSVHNIANCVYNTANDEILFSALMHS